MKRFFTIAAFFWACTFTQQAQLGPAALVGDMQKEWSGHFLASGQKGGAFPVNPAILTDTETIQNVD
jgi:hypothetical protein